MNTAPATGSDINQIVNSALFLQQAENSSSINMQQQQLYMHFDANSTNGTTTTPPQSFASLPPQSAANTAMQQQHLNKTLHNSLLEKMASNNNNNNNIHNSNSNLSSLEASGNFFPRTSQLSTESNTSSLETSSNIQRQFEFIDGRRKVGSIDSAAFMMMGGGGADFDGNNNDKRNSASYIWTSQDAPAGATTNMTTTLRVNFYSEARNSTSPTRSSFSGPVSAFSTNNGGAISSSSKSPNSSSPSTGKKVYKYAPRTFGNKNNQTRSASNSNSNLSAILNDPNMDENERKRVVKNDLQNRFKQRLESKGGQPPEEQVRWGMIMMKMFLLLKTSSFLFWFVLKEQKKELFKHVQSCQYYSIPLLQY